MFDPSAQQFALVTGAGSGLGRAFALRLAREDWQVAAADINDQAALETQAAIGNACHAQQLDVTSPESWKQLCDDLRQRWPRLDLLVNNAGVCGSGEVGNGLWLDARGVLEVNLHGVMLGCHTLIPWMKETAPGGQIVNIASIAAILSAPAMSAYNASKAGVIAYSETLAAELLDLGITVTVVLPGFFSTQLLTRGVFAEEVHRQMAEDLAKRSKFTADDVVDATLAALRRKQLHVVVGRRAKWLWRLKRVMPERFVRSIARRYQQKLLNYQKSD